MTIFTATLRVGATRLSFRSTAVPLAPSSLQSTDPLSIYTLSTNSHADPFDVARLKPISADTMNIVNITIDDTSPQIRYQGTQEPWSAIHDGDSLTNRYYLETFYSSRFANDSATLTFRAETVTILGAKRPNHGLYTVTLDGQESVPYNGQGQAQLQQELYSAHNLDIQQDHTIVVRNRADLTSPPLPDGDCWLDIDLVILSSTLVLTSTLDDTDPAFTYSEGWSTESGQSRYNNTATGTGKPGSAVDFRFTGKSVQIFGSLDVDHGNYSVSLDGGEAINLTGAFYQYTPGVSLYAATGLVQGDHTIRFVNIGSNNGSTFDIDYAIVNSTVQPSSSVLPVFPSSTTSTLTSTVPSSILAAPTTIPVVTAVDSSPSSSPTPNTKEADRSGALIGGVLGGLIALTLLIFCLSLHLNKIRRKRRAEMEKRMMSQLYLNAGVSVFPSRDGYTDQLGGSEGESTVWMSDRSTIRTSVMLPTSSVSR